MTPEERFILERNEVLKSLDEARLDAFARKWEVPQPASWEPGAKTASMHKARLAVDAFTSTEKKQSREWLRENGFTEETNRDTPCPQCGGRGFSFSSCPTCGRAQ